tara:strand:+ start:878 stop:1366 length:489 start_codon:yes stop_codon:yes gene_type:complete
MEGAGGLNATVLNGSIDENDTIIPVDTTAGFLTAGVIVIGNEQIYYAGVTPTSFTGAIRGFRDTTIESYQDNRAVYSRDAGVLNRALGFEVITTGAAIGTTAVANIAFTFMTRSLGYLISFNFAFLTGDLVYLRYLFMAPAVGLVIVFAFQALSTAFGIIRK